MSQQPLDQFNARLANGEDPHAVVKDAYFSGWETGIREVVKEIEKGIPESYETQPVETQPTPPIEYPIAFLVSVHTSPSSLVYSAP